MDDEGGVTTHHREWQRGRAAHSARPGSQPMPTYGAATNTATHLEDPAADAHEYRPVLCDGSIVILVGPLRDDALDEALAALDPHLHRNSAARIVQMDLAPRRFFMRPKRRLGPITVVFLNALEEDPFPGRLIRGAD